jgi:hypothetical protein
MRLLVGAVVAAAVAAPHPATIRVGSQPLDAVAADGRDARSGTVHSVRVGGTPGGIALDRATAGSATSAPARSSS